MTYDELFNEFCEWNPDLVSLIDDYRPWGTNSIIIWLKNGMAYKAKRIDANKFVMQSVTKEDVDKKYGLNK